MLYKLVLIDENNFIMAWKQRISQADTLGIEETENHVKSERRNGNNYKV